MTCLPLSLIDDYLENEMLPEKVKSFEEHILGCSHCRQMLAERRRFLEACSHLPDLPLPLNWAKTVMVKITHLGPTFPGLIIAVIASLAFFLSSTGLLFFWLQSQALSANSFGLKSSPPGLIKAALLFLTKASLAVILEVQALLRPLTSFPSGISEPFSFFGLEFVVAIGMATAILGFLLGHYYLHSLAKKNVQPRL